MKKALLLSASLLVLIAGMSSCKKCYVCTLSQRSQTNSGNDTTIILRSELCNQGAQGAGNNLSSAVKDIEANGYICQPK